MLIGIMSDSHGQELIVAAALRFFDSVGAEHVVHCGDVGGRAVLDRLIGRRCSWVWGNMDAGDDELRDCGAAAGCSPLRLELDGKVLLVFHGHERGVDQAVAENEPDYVLHGHTHAARDQRVGHVRIINPGALHRASPKTIATLDTATDEVSFYAFDSQGGRFAPWTLPR